MISIPDEDISTREGLSVGDEVVFYDSVNNKAIGEAKIAQVINSGKSVSFRIDRDLDITRYCKVGIYRWNKNFQVKNSYIEGTVRVRSSGTFSNCKFNVFWVRIENETDIEGPVPKDITFSNCTFTTSYSADATIFHVGTLTKSGSSGAYKCKNIVLSGCTFQKGKYYAESGNQLIVK